MEDTDINESVKNASGAEKLTPPDKTGVFTALRNWIKKDFKDKLKKLIESNVATNPAARLKRDIDLSTLMNSHFLRVLNSFVAARDLEENISTLNEWNEVLKKDLFDDHDPNSVVNSVKGPRRQLAKDQFLGPISILTFVDLIKGSVPNPEGKLSLSKIVISGKSDVENKIDLELRFGDRSEKGEIVRLIQLKTSGRDEFSIWGGVSEDFIPAEFTIQHHGDPQDIYKMADYARKMEENSTTPLDVRTFFVVLPGWDTNAIDNVFGIVTNQRFQRIEAFKENAIKEGLLPKVIK